MRDLFPSSGCLSGRRSAPSGLALLLVLLLSTATAPAQAQSAANAEALFNKGLAEMAAGHYDVACPAIAESQRLDPTPGTLFTLAECEAKAGKIAAALVHYTEYLQQFEAMKGPQRLNHDERARIASTQRKALQQDVPTVRLVLPAGVPAGVRVTRNGVALEAASLGIALPVDPGEHVITTQAPGGPLVTQRLTVSRGEAKTLELKVVPAAPVVRQNQAKPPPSDAPAAATAPDAGKGRRIAGFVVGGVGIAGLLVGGIAGGIALGKARIRDDNCQQDVKACNWEGYAAHTEGLTAANVSTAGFAIGLAALATGTVLILTAPAAKKPQSTQAILRAGILGAGPGGALVGMEGAF